MRSTFRGPMIALAAMGLAAVSACSAPASSSDAAVVQALNDEPPASNEGPPPETTPESPDPDAITLVFGGDVHFERGLKALVEDPTSALDPISDQLSRADLAMVNLETAITSGGTPEPKAYTFRTSPSALDVLKNTGVDVVTMGNNHVVDYGAEGLADTLAAKESSPIPVVGVGADQKEAFEPAEFDIKGTKIAVLGATEVYERTSTVWAAGKDKPGVASALDPAPLLRAVRGASKNNDVVIAYMHWGYERQTCPSGNQTTLADALIDAGADVIVGAHPHVLQGSGWKDGAFVAYSLGNFVWYNDKATTGVLTVTIKDGKPVQQGFDPATIPRNGVPDLMTGDKRTKYQQNFEELRGCTDLSDAPDPSHN